MRHFLLNCALSAFLFCPPFFGVSFLGSPFYGSPFFGLLSARAEISEIALIVNGQAISNFDIEQQARLLIITSNIAPSEDNLKKAYERAREQVIANSLKRSKAQENNIQVSEEEIQRALRNGLSQGRDMNEFLDVLKNNQVNVATLYDNITADLLWNKYVQRKIIPRIVLVQSEIDQQINQKIQNSGGKNFLLSQIVLLFDNQESKNKRGQEALRLKQQLNDGADFASLARNFSDGRNAGQGGDLGWVGEGALSQNFHRVVSAMKINDISPILQQPNGYSILHLRNIRKRAKIELSQVLLNLKMMRIAINDPNQVSKRTRKVLSDNPSCAQAEDYARSMDGEINDMGFVPLDDLSSRLRQAFKDSSEGKIIASIFQNGAQEFLILCGRKTQDNPSFSRRQIENQLLSEQAYIRARQELRNLRQNAHIEKK